jgi:sialate O-acetylesterase
LSTSTNNPAVVGGFPIIRWHQTFDVGYVPNTVVPKVFMAVALDLRDDPNGWVSLNDEKCSKNIIIVFSIHPRTKHDVGYRLSRAGLAVAYNQQVEFQGPTVSSVVYASGSSTVNITYANVQSIELRTPVGFEVCCQGAKCTDDTLWVAATVSGKTGLTIVGQQLYGLRYLWHETPCLFKQAALYSGTDANLPSPPYWKLF